MRRLGRDMTTDTRMEQVSVYALSSPPDHRAYSRAEPFYSSGYGKPTISIYW